MQKPLLVSIVGQTATGKTRLALELAHALLEEGKKKIVLLSADSKQVYKGLEILTGADIPKDFHSAEIHGVSCISGDEEWSVAHFQKLFEQLFKKLTEKDAMIIVGGTGLYHQQIFSPAETISLKPNPILRKKLAKLSLKELQLELQKTWPDRWTDMNHSDQNNPRRLIRAIEVRKSAQRSQPSHNVSPVIQLGLSGSSNAKAIEMRVAQRLADGAIAEVKKFETKYPGAVQAKSALGYQEILEHLQQKISLEELQALWTLHETQYAKRQQTWWKKQPNIHWLPENNLLDTALEIIHS